MGQPKTIRFEDALEPKIEAYLAKNPDLTLAKLVNLAVRNFIEQPHSIELVPIDDKDVDETVKKIFKKHKKAMDDLK